MIPGLNYGTNESNIVNYSILLLSLYYAFIINDIRIFNVIIISTIIQLSLYLLPFKCFGISIIYCFIFGFIIKSKFDKNKLESIMLFTIVSFLLILSGLTFKKLRSNILYFIIFILYHYFFIIIGSMFTLL